MRSRIKQMGRFTGLALTSTAKGSLLVVTIRKIIPRSLLLELVALHHCLPVHSNTLGQVYIQDD